MATNNTDAGAYLNTTSGDHNAQKSTASGHTAQIKGSEAPFIEQTKTVDSDEPTMRLRSGRIVQKKWITAQAKLRKDKNNVGDNVRLQSTSSPPEAHPNSVLEVSEPLSTNPPSEARHDPGSDVPEVLSTSQPPDAPPKPVSDVFNIPELLEQILLNLETGFIILKIQRVCRGFKQSMDLSPSFQERPPPFAFKIDFDVDQSAVHNGAPSFHVNLRPSCMYRRVDSPWQCSLGFVFGGARPSFRSLVAMEGFRNLRVFDEVPDVLEVTAYSRARVPSYLGCPAEWDDENDRWKEFTFGQIFDAAAAERNPVENMNRLWIVWRRQRRHDGDSYWH
jgi:hypothetical protein